MLPVALCREGSGSNDFPNFGCKFVQHAFSWLCHAFADEIHTQTQMSGNFHCCSRPVAGGKRPAALLRTPRTSSGSTYECFKKVSSSSSPPHGRFGNVLFMLPSI